MRCATAATVTTATATAAQKSKTFTAAVVQRSASNTPTTRHAARSSHILATCVAAVHTHHQQYELRHYARGGHKFDVHCRTWRHHIIEPKRRINQPFSTVAMAIQDR